MKFMKKYNYIIFTFFWVICGLVYVYFENNLDEREVKNLIKVEFSKPLKLKKRFLKRPRAGRGWILNDSFLPATTIASFDRKFWLADNWGAVDSLIKEANSDTLKCILYSGEVKYLEVDNPANDDGW